MTINKETDAAILDVTNDVSEDDLVNEVANAIANELNMEEVTMVLSSVKLAQIYKSNKERVTSLSSEDKVMYLDLIRKFDGQELDYSECTPELAAMISESMVEKAPEANKMDAKIEKATDKILSKVEKEPVDRKSQVKNFFENGTKKASSYSKATFTTVTEYGKAIVEGAAEGTINGLGLKVDNTKKIFKIVKK
jgi:hypothetical protein